MNRRFINQIRDNEVIDEVYQISEKSLRTNKNGNYYIQGLLSDKSGVLSIRLWNATEEMYEAFENGDFVRIQGTVQRFQGTLQCIAKKITKVESDSVVPDDFRRFSEVDTVALLKRLREILKGIRNPALLNLCECFLVDDVFITAFAKAPAGIRLHHAYSGGLLVHTLTMLETALKIIPLYSAFLNADVLLTGIFLHDVGKTEEMTAGDTLSYTDLGQLLGHPFLGVEILQRKIKETEQLTGEPFDPELAMLLKHMLISHHGILENGSSKPPMTAEALALHLIDSLDAKLTEFQKYVHDDPSPDSAWTNYIPSLERKIYKGKDKSPE